MHLHWSHILGIFFLGGDLRVLPFSVSIPAQRRIAAALHGITHVCERSLNWSRDGFVIKVRQCVSVYNGHSSSLGQIEPCL